MVCETRIEGGAFFASRIARCSLLVTRSIPVTPNPAPRPAATIGCFVVFVFGLLSVVVLGASLNDVALIVLLAVVFVALILLFVRIVFRDRPPPPAPPP